MKIAVVTGLAAVSLVLGLSPAAALASAAQAPARMALPVTTINVNGDGGDRVYDGVGAVLGGGGNARYLMDYPAAERTGIMDYLFKPGYGASLQLLKLEIGGDANSSDGAEPSVEHTRGKVDCGAGYELAIARQAVALNPYLKLYGLQWAAPGWVGQGTDSVFTRNDISYLLGWLGCARQHGLTISYLGGWNESDTGSHAAWFARLRSALNAHGYPGVQIVAADTFVPGSSDPWPYTSDASVAILGNHDMCGYPTGTAGAQTTCTTTRAALDSGKPLWASELGAMDAGAQPGCVQPCAPAMDRAAVRGYIDARLTGYLEWPVLDAMPPGLPYENRGLVTADQPWSGSYSVNAMTWAIAQFTQFVWPPWRGNPGGWRYVDSGSGFLRGNRADGSYVTLVRSGGTDWSTIVETTSATSDQQASFTVSGGQNLAGDTVHVWASNFDFGTDSPAQWFVRQPSITPSGGKFTITLKPGWVYSLTTTTGQGKGIAVSPAPAAFPLPYRDSLSSSGQAGTGDDEPQYLAAMDGAFELAPCQVPDGSNTTCTEQEAAPTPVLWQGVNPATATRFPFAVIGDSSLASYTVSCDVLLTQPGTSAGLIGRFSGMKGPQAGDFDGYVFDVSTTGAWKLVDNNETSSDVATLASGRTRRLRTGSWHRLSLSLSGGTITASVDGKQVTSVTSSTWTAGPAGLEAGAFTHEWPRVQYSNLVIAP
jgi:Glycosyl hydrolase family 59